jgi:hypothetical protein
MFKYILMVILAVASNSAMAEWVKVGGSDAFTTYTDPATLLKAGNSIRMWTLVDFKTVKTASNKQFKSLKSQYEFDCKGERLQILANAFHAENMGGGAVVLGDSNLGKWVPVTPGSVGHNFWQAACAKR